MLLNLPCTTVPQGNRVAVEDRVRSATRVAVHSFKIAGFCDAKCSSSAEETNKVQIGICLFSPQFSLSLNYSYSYSTVCV